jgi:hypothetical protein
MEKWFPCSWNNFKITIKLKISVKIWRLLDRNLWQQQVINRKLHKLHYHVLQESIEAKFIYRPLCHLAYFNCTVHLFYRYHLFFWIRFKMFRDHQIRSYQKLMDMQQ